jgi:hypothetical protein
MREREREIKMWICGERKRERERGRARKRKEVQMSRTELAQVGRNFNRFAQVINVSTAKYFVSMGK